MVKYDYNVRCKRCNIGFNPKDKDGALRKLCSACIQIRNKEYLEFKEHGVCTS